MLSRIARNFIKLNLSLLFVLFLIALNVLLVVSNYLACKISFELLGTENRPLGTDELVGPFFRAFFGQASLAHLYAMLVAVTVSVGLFLILKLGFDTLNLLEDQRIYSENRDEQSAQITRRRIFRNLIMIGIFALPLGFAIYWDIHLFRFRSIAQVMGYEYPEMVIKLVSWSGQLRQKGGQWVWFLTRIGAWGYLGITAICCLSLEYAIYRAGESWALLVDALSEPFQSRVEQEVQPEDYDYGQHLPPDNRPNIPVSREPEGVPVASQNGAGVGPGNGSGRPDNISFSGQIPANVFPRSGVSAMPVGVSGGGDNPSDGVAGSQFVVGDGNNGRGQTNRPGGVLFDSAPGIPVAGETVHSQVSGRRETEAALYPVIGSPNGERVSLADALANPEQYWVDPDTHEIWSVDYRGTLMQSSVSQK